MARCRASARRSGASGSAGRRPAPGIGSFGGSAFISRPHGKPGARLPADAAAGDLPAWPRGCPAPGRGAGRGLAASALRLGPLDRLDDQPLGFVGIAPARDLHPLARLEVLVVLEEVLDLVERD